jgi:hypothetical protein
MASMNRMCLRQDIAQYFCRRLAGIDAMHDGRGILIQERQGFFGEKSQAVMDNPLAGVVSSRLYGGSMKQSLDEFFRVAAFEIKDAPNGNAFRKLADLCATSRDSVNNQERGGWRGEFASGDR